LKIEEGEDGFRSGHWHTEPSRESGMWNLESSREGLEVGSNLERESPDARA
jgi:hypothetical protein